MRHVKRVSQPLPAQGKGTDPEDLLLGGLIYCLISGDCDLDDVKNVFGFLNIFD